MLIWFQNVFLASRRKKRYNRKAFRKSDYPATSKTVVRMARSHQIIVYLDADAATHLKAAALQRRMSASAYAKLLLDRELARGSDGKKDIVALQTEILIGVDALLKHHPNEKLFGVVKATRVARLAGSSDGA